MTKTEMQAYRQTLLDLARGVRGTVAGVAEETFRRTGADSSGNLSNTPVHLADLSSDTYEHEVAISLLENEGQLLDQIVAALERIEQGTYGRCTECSQAIPADRLRVLPYTPYCVNCAGRVEQGAREGS